MNEIYIQLTAFLQNNAYKPLKAKEKVDFIDSQASYASRRIYMFAL